MNKKIINNTHHNPHIIFTLTSQWKVFNLFNESLSFGNLQHLPLLIYYDISICHHSIILTFLINTFHFIQSSLYAYFVSILTFTYVTKPQTVTSTWFFYLNPQKHCQCIQLDVYPKPSFIDQIITSKTNITNRSLTTVLSSSPQDKCISICREIFYLM